MKVKALRGVCVGPEDDMKEGDVRDLDPGTADYLKNIGAAVDLPVEAEAPPPGPTPEQEAAASAAAASGTETAPAA